MKPLTFWIIALCTMCFIGGMLIGQVSVAGGPEQQIIPEGARGAEGWIAYLQGKLVHEHGWGAIVGGLLVSWVLTHLLKMGFPVDWTERKVQWRIKWTAFWTGALPTLLIWPLTFQVTLLNGQQIYAMVVTAIIAAIVVGGGSPFAYKVVVGTLTSQLVKRGFLQPEHVSAAANAEMRRTLATDTENGF